jgi:hypothetical protein
MNLDGDIASKITGFTGGSRSKIMDAMIIPAIGDIVTPSLQRPVAMYIFVVPGILPINGRRSAVHGLKPIPKALSFRSQALLHAS